MDHIFVGWTKVDDYDILGWSNKTVNTFSLGVICKVSRTFNVSDKFALEPEIKFNQNFSNETSFIGVNLAAKYKF